MDSIRSCIDGVCKVIDYWIDEADLTLSEITYILKEVDLTYTEEREDWEKEKEEDDEEEV
jgi:hypothetical protein